MDYKDLRESWDLPEEKELLAKVCDVYKRSLATEYVALLLVHFKTLAEDKIKLQRAVSATLKVMQTELATVLIADEQTVKAPTLFHTALQAKITVALKMK
jgi:hypothetical protein